MHANNFALLITTRHTMKALDWTSWISSVLSDLENPFEVGALSSWKSCTLSFRKSVLCSISELMLWVVFNDEVSLFQWGWTSNQSFYVERGGNLDEWCHTRRPTPQQHGTCPAEKHEWDEFSQSIFKDTYKCVTNFFFLIDSFPWMWLFILDWGFFCLMQLSSARLMSVISTMLIQL